jgi:hypothetical protein
MLLHTYSSRCANTTPNLLRIDMDANNMHGTIPASVEAWTELTGICRCHA